MTISSCVRLRQAAAFNYLNFSITKQTENNLAISLPQRDAVGGGQAQ